MKKLRKHLLGAFSVFIMFYAIFMLRIAETSGQLFFGIFLTFVSLCTFLAYEANINPIRKNKTDL